MKHLYTKLLLVIVLFCVGSWQSNAQLIGASGYLLGDNVEIGINDSGHEGAPRLIGSNNRSNLALGSPVYFGFVANPQLDGWGNYDGDFFTPGTPENGFGIEVAGVNYSNNASGDIEQIPGSISSYSEVGDCIYVVWDGTVANVNVHVVYRLIKTELYYTTEVTLTNVGPTDMTNVYYYRNLDPDNNITLGAGYATQNTIVAQPSPACEKALVTATQVAPWASYMGFGAIGLNFRVSYGGFANRDASNLWNGIGFTNTVGSSIFADQAIAISYRAETLAVGVPEKFLYTVVLDASQIDAAIASLYFFDYEGGGGIIDECAPIIDTAKMCLGYPVTLTVDGPSADSYVWTWSPPDGLSTTDGPTTEASPIVTTEYTVTGTPAPLCLSATIEKKIVVELTPSPIIEITDPGPQCGEFDLTTLELTNLEGSPVDISFYSIIPDSIDQIDGLWPTDFMTVGDTVYILMANSETGCYDIEMFVVDFSGNAEAGLDNAAVICNDPSAFIDLNGLLSGAEPDGIWIETSPVLSGGFDPITAILTGDGVDAGDYTFEYIAIGLAPCENDTAVMTITINEQALAGLDGASSICNTDGSTFDLNDLLDGNNAIGTWAETTASGQFTPGTGIFDASGLAAGDYTFTYTVTALDPCVPDVADFTITILPNPAVDAGADFAICIGDDATLSGSGAGVGGTYVWDGGVIDGTPFTPTETAIYIVTGTDVNGCENTDAVQITVNPLPIVSAGVDVSVCDGDPVTLSGSGVGIIGVYVWSGGVINGEAFVPDASGTYIVTGTDINGCSNNDTVDVILNPLPIIDAGEDVTVCENALVTLSGSGAGIGGVYNWTGGILNGVEFTIAATTVFNVFGIDLNGCANTDEVTITVNPLPIIDAGEDFAICFGTDATLSGSGAGVGGTYVWDGGVIDGTAFTPMATNTYTVTGTDVNGCVNTDDVEVTVNLLPLIDAGADMEICEGDAVTLSGTGAGAGGTYLWSDGVLDGVAFNPLSSDSFILTGTDVNGCANQDTMEIVVNALPTIDAGEDFSVCESVLTVLMGTGAGAGGTYIWDGGVIDGVEFTLDETTTFTVIGTDVNGCSNTDDVLVTLFANPVVEAGEPSEICEGEWVILAGAGAGVGAVYEWEGGGVDGAAFAPTETNMYWVLGTDINGCSSMDSVVVAVNPLPTVDAGPNNSICIGESITLTAIGDAGLTFTWDMGIVDGVSFAPDATATYTVTGVDDLGCSNSDPVTISVLALPIIDAGSDLNICRGETAVLHGSGAGYDGTYSWDSGVTDGVPFSPTVTGTYTVTGTSGTGCSNTDLVVVFVNPLPNVSFSADPLIGCAPLRVEFNSETPGTHYSWSFGDGSTSSMDDPFHTYAHSGLYDVTLYVKDENGCFDRVTYNSYIDVKDTPIADFNYSPDEIDITNTRVQFQNHTIYADSYEWTFGDGVTETDESPEHIYPELGNISYLITLTASNENGCVDVAEQYIEIKDVLIYYVPNTFTPDGDTYNESFTPVFAAGVDIFDYHLIVFNRWGEVVFESYDTNFGWNGMYGDGGLAEDGVYIWRMDFGETMSDKRHQVEGHVTILK